MPTFNELRSRQQELIRKGLEGAIFVKRHEATDPPITSLMDASGLLALPPGYSDVGHITKDQGANWTRDIATSDVMSLGATEPTRRDITSDVTGLAFTMQESKRAVFELYEGVDLSAVTQDAGPATAAVDEVQTVTISGAPTGGTFTLTFNGATTADIAHNATGATVQAALEALSTIGSGNVTVSGAGGGPYTVTFVGTLGGQNVPEMTATGSFTGGTSPSIAVATTTEGVAESAYNANVTFDKPDRPASTHYRALALFKDGDGADAIYFAKWLPRVQVTDRGEQSWNEDNELQYAVTLTAFVDSIVGTSARTLWAGPGLTLTSMGFPAAP